MNSTLFLPKKIKVGYQKRDSTYTGKLAYVIYYDQKGKLKKETSWENWRDKTIEPQEFDNVPTEGFVLNKKVGDYSCDWNHRKAYTRVYDPRGFEFEITIENLLYILENTSSIKGKGLEGEFVYTWSGQDIVLMPTCSPDFEAISEYNDVLQSNKKFNTKNMIIGATYRDKDNQNVVYIGRYPVYGTVYEFDGKEFTSYIKVCNYAKKNNKIVEKWVSGGYGAKSGWKQYYKRKTGVTGKEYWFAYMDSSDDYDEWKLWHFSSSSNIIDVVDEKCIENYAELFELMESDHEYSPYDPSKDERIEYTFDEFMGKVSEHNIHSVIFDFCGKQRVLEFEIERKNNELFIGPKYWQQNLKDNELMEIFGYSDDTRISKKFMPMLAKDFFEKYKPYYKKLYLENGKFWKEHR